MFSLSIVIPCFNEEKRILSSTKIIHEFLDKNLENKIEIIFVNDGSSDKTLSYIERINFKNSNHKKKIISYNKNIGKGYACKKGVLESDFEWILLCDADMAASPKQINKWFNEESIKKNDICYFGSRNHKDSIIKSKINRKLIGRCLNILLYVFFKNRISDTQCGFKLFNKKYAKKIFGKLETYRFAYDIEIIQLLKINDIKIKELPIKWEHKAGSKISLFKDSLKMIIDILKIKYKKNRNDRYFT